MIRYLQARKEAKRARKHELWLQKARQDLQLQLRVLALQQRRRQPANLAFFIDRRLLMLLTLEPPLLNIVRQTLNDLPAASMLEFELSLFSWNTDDCRNPPSDEALLATAMELAHFTSRFDLLRRLYIFNGSASITREFLVAFPRLTFVHLHNCYLETDHIQSLFSIPTLRRLDLHTITGCLRRCESIDAFCFGVISSRLETLSMRYVYIHYPEHQRQVATALAYCNTLVDFSLSYGVRQPFRDQYCLELSSNVHTKLERLYVQLHTSTGAKWELDFQTPYYWVARDPFTAAMTDEIYNLLQLNVQRATFPPLFAAIGNAETDAECIECLMRAFEAVDLPLLFENMTANKSNIIKLIQQLGRER